jgi:hypothetical protein
MNSRRQAFMQSVAGALLVRAGKQGGSVRTDPVQIYSAGIMPTSPVPLRLPVAILTPAREGRLLSWHAVFAGSSGSEKKEKKNKDNCSVYEVSTQ